MSQPLAADVFAESGCPYRTVDTIATNAAIDFERNGTVGHLDN